MLLTQTQSRGMFGLADLASSASVQQLQQALVNLAISTGRPAINPGAVTGEMNDQTVVAVSSAMGLLTEELPSSIYLVLQAGLLVGSATSQAKKLVEQYAPQLTIAANTAAIKFQSHQQPPTVPVVVQPETSFFGNLFAPGWYKTPFGMVIIGVGAFAIYKLFLAPRPAAAAA